MESSNIYHHQQQPLQQQLAGYSSLATQSGQGPSIAIHDLNPSIILNLDECDHRMNEILPKELYVSNANFIPLVQNTMFQDTGSIHHVRSYAQQSTINGSISDCLIESSDHTNGSIYDTNHHVKLQQQNVASLDLNEDESSVGLSSFSSINGQPRGHELLAKDSYVSNLDSADQRLSRLATSSSHAYSFSNMGLSSSLVSTSPGMDSSNMDALNCRNNGELSFRQSHISYCQIQRSSGNPSNSSDKLQIKTSAYRNSGLKAKRQVNFMDVKPSHDQEAKKPRTASSRSSSSALNVRKEKLGDRIAALHRMVAPFGKTDTASVLTEAIGYIQFLQNQIQSLSTTYVKSSHSRRRRTTQRDAIMEDEKEDEAVQDLRSRGLCLVPLSFTSYMSSYQGGLL